MPSSVVFLPIFPTGWTTNKQKTPIKDQSLQVMVDPLICRALAFCPKCDSFSRLASLCTLQLLQGTSGQVCTTCLVSFGRKWETAAGTRSTGSSHGDAAHSLPTFTSLSAAVPFPSWRQKPVLRLQTFPFLPLWSTVGTFPYIIIGICQHGNSESAEAACCSQHLPHLFVLWRYNLGLLHSKTVIKEKLLPMRTGTRKR